MLRFLLAYLGGVLTIVSPCILPVLPFVFARSDRPFLRSGLPLLVGMAATFAAVATLAAVGAGWAVAANHWGRVLAIVLLALFGLTLLVPSLSDRLTRPLVALGARLQSSADATGGSIRTSLLLGVATGLLWAPCAGPILGLILTGAALNGANLGTTFLLLAYAAGAATSLALALLVGGRVFKAMKRSLGVGEWVRRALGVAVLAAVVAIAFGADTGVLTRLSLGSTNALEQRLYNRLAAPTPTPAPSLAMTGPSPVAPVKSAALSPPPGTTPVSAQPAAPPPLTLPVEGTLPPLGGAVAWLNTPPLTAAALRGKVVLIDFWTYSCINCLRTIPYIRAWAEKYRAQGLVVIGVHAPEFAFEKTIDNVKTAVADLRIDYPVAIDDNYAIWRGFNNQYWPADYFVDAQGRIRHHEFGEGGYDEAERTIQQLLAESGHAAIPTTLVAVAGTGAEAAADMDALLSPETYVGTDRAQNFVSPEGARADRPHGYTAPDQLQQNQWALRGTWTLTGEHGTLDAAPGRIVYRFHARDLHLVLGPGPTGAPIRFRVTVDGAPPGANHGVDTDATGAGTVTTQRLYQLVRQQPPIADRTFEIEFLDPAVQAYAFTFG